ncbi:uncharacterized protein LOC131929506 [Physella acuta]|uniref:uncharacterized protein LOC131929506 n=1 Tax=Physella acuta TaxID=109671 RepID=UPI0027DE2745|nr:uncharacterized protein LOC131929506 [Physella acuta]
MAYSFKILSGFLVLLGATHVHSACVVYTKVYQFSGPSTITSVQACKDFCVSLKSCISYIRYQGECVVAQVGVGGATETDGSGYVVCDEIASATTNNKPRSKSRSRSRSGSKSNSRGGRRRFMSGPGRRRNL